MLRVVVLAIAFLISSPSIAGEVVPINATFGIGWMPSDQHGLIWRAAGGSGERGQSADTILDQRV